MRLHEIEAWALRIVDDVSNGRPNEDARVELKTEWPRTPEEAARQIAGHANAAGGSPILWIIGLNQKRGVEGAEHRELASWYAQVQNCFDGLAPHLTDINVPVGGNSIVALLFETDRAPFVVKNPAFNKPGGGVVQREVPWREGTSVRSARREELLRLLSPLQHLPRFEIIGGKISAHPDSYQKELIEWFILFHIYVVPNESGRIALPFHYCQAYLMLPGEESGLLCQDLTLNPITKIWVDVRGINSESYSQTVIPSDTEVIVDGPGTIMLKAEVSTSKMAEFPEEIECILKLKTSSSLGNISLYSKLNRNLERETRERQSTPRLQGVWQTGAPL